MDLNIDVDKVCEKAEDIAKRYNPGNIAPFPFGRIEEHLSDLYIAFTNEIAANISGAIGFDKEDGGFTVLINKKKPRARRNFAIAHELGHYFLHKDQIEARGLLMDMDDFLDGPLDELGLERERELEIEANHFAISLIMPKEFVFRAWIASRDIESCANIFNVSVPVISARLEKLKLVSS